MSAKGSLSVTIKPSAKALSSFFSRGQRKNASDVMRAVAEVVNDQLKDETPRKTGRLVNSQRLIEVNDLHLQIVEFVNPPYGLFQRQGVAKSKINPIMPRKKKALWWPGARHPVKIVRNHPGIKPNPYTQRAVDKSKEKAQREAEKLGSTIEVQIEAL